MTSPQERAARIAWARLSEPTEAVMFRWVQEHGHVEALRRVREGLLGVGRAVAERSRSFDVLAEEAAAARLGARIVVPGDDEWPPGVDDLAMPPHALWVGGHGRLAEVCERSVSIVGARAATTYGMDVARGIAHGMASRDFTVVSGAAYGIDAAAHEGSLAVGGCTVAVLACGIDRPYPQAHRGLLNRILEAGCVVTELPPGSAPLAKRFLARNRLIAAMTAGTAVVEAGLRSGSLNTAAAAQQLDRHVAAVPGPVTSMLSAGCHELVRNRGATLVTDAAELADLVGALGRDTAPERREVSLDSSWSPADKVVHGWVPVRAPATVDSLVKACDLPVTAVLASLTRLELCGAVRRTDAGWLKVPEATGRTSRRPTVH